MSMKHVSVGELQKRLISANHKTRSVLVMDKTERALADIRRALTYLEKAEATLIWAEARL